MDINNTQGFDSEDEDTHQDTAPPGNEGFDISHEGGGFEVFDDLAEGVAVINR